MQAVANQIDSRVARKEEFEEQLNKAEEVATIYLKRQGIEVLEKDWRSGSGQADLIYKEDNELVFADVRASTTGELPEETNEEIRAGRKAAEKLVIDYLSTHNYESCRIRFDIIAVGLLGKSKAFLRHHRDAYSAGD
ncbi:MAG: YraN family protein [Coriobacteriales bacterium]|jgi:putative endonuclease|nr:YraN family protein [Coriobacteriales bacterium]